ncbi:MAG: ABC transporter substrate-binding protein [Conexivisphaerales archaeon]|nr:ABC transporter substrate-binding protein [Conexivisphaerales archaeon]
MRRSAISGTALWAIIAVVIIIVIVGGVAAYYATRPPPPKPSTTTTTTRAIVGQVTIGIEDSLTGSLGPIGEEGLWSAQLAANQINSQGGIYLANGPNGPGNYTINLVWQDDQSSPSNGPTATATLITDDHAAILLTTPASDVAIADIPIIEQYKEPSLFMCLSPLATRTQNLTNFDPAKYMIFHYQPTALQQGLWAAEFIVQVVKPQISPNAPIRIVYIGQDTEMGQDFLAGFNMSLYQNGWQNDVDLVDVMFYPAGNTQFQSILTAAATYHPQVLLLGTWTNEQAALSEQAAEIPQLKGVVQIGNAIDDDPSFYGPAGQAAAGVFVPTDFPSTALTSNATINAKWIAFKQALLAYSGHAANLPGTSFYDEMWIAAYALQDAGSTNSTAIIQALETMPPPSQLVIPVMATPQGTLFNSYHEATFQPMMIEAFWNSSSQSVYTQVVWPSQYATASPVLTGTP